MSAKQPFGDEEHGFWSEKVAGVEVVRTEDVTYGWAIFTGCEGDDPHFEAFVIRRYIVDALLGAVDTDRD